MLAEANKPREVEGVLDTYLIRPLGYLVATLSRRTAITPNMLSVAAVIAALFCALSYASATLLGAYLGLAFMLMHSAFDSSDGQLARLTGRDSDSGAIIDGICDHLSFTVIYIGLWASYVAHGGPWPIAVFAFGVFTGVLHSLQSALVDFQRRLYVYYNGRKRDLEISFPEQIEAELATVRGHSWNPKRILLSLRLSYSKRQRKFLKSTDKLQRLFEKSIKENPAALEHFVALYRRENRFILHWWTLMAPNTHKVGIVIAAFIPFIFTAGWLHRVGAVSYYFFDMALTVPMFLLIWGQSRVNRRILRAIENNNPST